MYEYMNSVPQYIDGKLTPPEEVEKLCESMEYMADYILDDEGNIREIRYDKVVL